VEINTPQCFLEQANRQDSAPSLLQESSTMSEDDSSSASPIISSSSDDASSTSLKDEHAVGHEPQIVRSHHDRRHVSCGTVSVQEHQLVLGDSPYSDGYPISIDWKHAAQKTMRSLDEFEQDHTELEKLDLHERQLRLQHMGYRKVDLQKQERKRKILLAEEWAFGDNKNDQPIFGLLTTMKLMQRYVTR
jgi:hypothetical protein